MASPVLSGASSRSSNEFQFGPNQYKMIVKVNQKSKIDGSKSSKDKRVNQLIKRTLKMAKHRKNSNTKLI
jgi:hypothetical protein